jgi:chitodextrinase
MSDTAGGTFDYTAAQKNRGRWFQENPVATAVATAVRTSAWRPVSDIRYTQVHRVVVSTARTRVCLRGLIEPGAGRGEQVKMGEQPDPRIHDQEHRDRSVAIEARRWWTTSTPRIAVRQKQERDAEKVKEASTSNNRRLTAGGFCRPMTIGVEEIHTTENALRSLSIETCLEVDTETLGKFLWQPEMPVYVGTGFSRFSR